MDEPAIHGQLAEAGITVGPVQRDLPASDLVARLAAAVAAWTRKAGCTFALALATAAALLVGCGGHAQAPAAQTPAARAPHPPAAVVSDRDGPSWKGRLGETVRVDWYDQRRGETHSELVAVLAVKRLPNPDDDDGPDEFGDDYGPYEWKYGIKVRLTSLDEQSARRPAAYQFIQLTDGRDSEDGVSGLGRAGGPDPSRPGRSSVGWLYQWAEQGFKPTHVTLPVGARSATWSLD